MTSAIPKRESEKESGFNLLDVSEMTDMLDHIDFEMGRIGGREELENGG